jgi:hypothetical protein
VSSIAAPASLPCSPVALSIHHKDDEIQPAQQRVRAACSNCLAQTEVFTPMGSCLLLSLMLPQVAVAVWKNPSSVGALGGIRTPDPQIRKDCSRITGLEQLGAYGSGDTVARTGGCRSPRRCERVLPGARILPDQQSKAAADKVAAWLNGLAEAFASAGRPAACGGR